MPTRRRIIGAYLTLSVDFPRKNNTRKRNEKMRRIFLIRHGKPLLPSEDGRFCLGRQTDPPLSESGRMQALDFGAAFDFIPAESFYSSSLIRSRETAELLLRGRGEVKLLPGIEELGCGEWEGLSFAEIRRRYPEIYAARKNDMSIPPPGGESFDSAADRALSALYGLLSKTVGDLAVVAHAGVNRAVMCRLSGLPMSRNRELDQQYACVNVLIEDKGRLFVSASGKASGSFPDERELFSLYEKCGTPENIRRHCRAVAEKAARLAQALPPGSVNAALLYSAALTHDLCRTGPGHELAAAELLRACGYVRLARIVSAHHDAPEAAGMDEEKLLFLADKLVDGERETTLERRFDRSAEKCKTQEARAAHEKRRMAALRIYDEFEGITGKRAETV